MLLTWCVMLPQRYAIAFRVIPTIGGRHPSRLHVKGASRQYSATSFFSLAEYEQINNSLSKRFNSYREHKLDIPSLIPQHEAVQTFEEEFNLIRSLYSQCSNDDPDADNQRKQCQEMLSELEDRFSEYRREVVFERPTNKGSDCFIEILAGAGGEDAFDWVHMLVKMYLGWAKNRSYKSTIVSTTQGDGEQGLRQATMRITGNLAFGWLRAEAGVHRLVRISPFDPQHKRHTSFAQVIVYPHIESAINAKSFSVPDSEIRFDTFRSSGAGGQSVQKTDSAVRLTHVPTGIAVSCQNERSQHQNKAFAMNVLRSKLYSLELERLEKQRIQSMVGNGESSWGNQIKSVVLNPYQLVKDHRSKWECRNIESYLAGDEELSESMENQIDFQFERCS